MSRLWRMARWMPTSRGHPSSRWETTGEKPSKKDGFANMFSIQAFKKNWEVLPLLGIISIATFGAISMLIYATSKPDVQFYRSGTAPYESVKKGQIHRLYMSIDRKEVKEDAELQALRKELGPMKTKTYGQSYGDQG